MMKIRCLGGLKCAFCLNLLKNFLCPRYTFSSSSDCQKEFRFVDLCEVMGFS